ncbi:MAG TPA: Uma2 family endonuclease, partial [Allocoleopsis sp.]
AVFTWSRIPKNPQGRIANQFNTYPDWIIEIFSPEESTNKVIKKILFCLNQGSQLGWLIDPEDESVMIFIPDKFPQILSNDENLPVLESLKHWELSVNQLFDWLNV